MSGRAIVRAFERGVHVCRDGEGGPRAPEADRVAVRSLETGAVEELHAVDARERLAAGGWELVTDNTRGDSHES